MDRQYYSLMEAYYKVYDELEQLDEVSAQTAMKASKAADNKANGMSHNGDHNGASKKRKQAVNLYQKALARANNKTQANESVDNYDLIMSYLLDEGFADTEADAEVIMANMSEEWLGCILEKFVSPYKGNVSYNNSQGHSPAMKAMKKSDDLQRTEPGSQRQKLQTRRSNQLNKMYHAARTSDLNREDCEIVLEYLLDEGFADTETDAEVIMANMSEDWLGDILEGFKPTNYNQGPDIFKGRGKKAQQLDRQIAKHKKEGNVVKSMNMDFINRIMDDPESRKESMEKSRRNRMKSDARARRDAQQDVKKYGLS